jgi:gamma-glutamyltranspeptidase/glutathione hydrolase
LPFTTRPNIMGTHGVVTSGHYLASAIGLDILRKGGNAVDAGVAMGFALSALEPQSYGIGGEAPILIYSAKDRRVYAVKGQGYAPRKATIGFFRRNKIRLIPWDGFLPATVPGAFDAWITALLRFGTLGLKDVLEPTVQLHEAGFPVYERLKRMITALSERMRKEWPSTAKIYLPDDRVPEVGQILKNADLAKTFRRLLAEETEHRSEGRERAIRAARDTFYKGYIAKEIVKFQEENEFKDATGTRHRGLLSLEDFEEYTTPVEEPTSFEYRGLTIHKCGPWSQGPVFLQQLSLLKSFDLKSLGHNSVEYIHLIVEAAKLAYADRESYGDPDFVDVSLRKLLSEEYATERRRLIDPESASALFRPGDLPPRRMRHRNIGGRRGDTTHLDSIDSDGNMIAATPSGGWFRASPVVEGLGFCLNTRGEIFNLDPKSPRSIQPRKRPRTTLSPTLVTKQGGPLMVFGTPGGDHQDQWTLQFFLNYVEFGMNLQEAIDAPSFHIMHFPESFYPHNEFPKVVYIENRIPAQVIKGLKRKGHRVAIEGGWNHGKVTAATIDEKTGLLTSAASPRGEVGYAMGW